MSKRRTPSVGQQSTLRTAQAGSAGVTHSQLLALEPRLVFDAAVVASTEAWNDSADHGDSTHGDPGHDGTGSVDSHTADSLSVAPEAPAVGAAAQPARVPAASVVIIESGAPGAGQALAEAGSDAVVHVLAPGENAIDGISRVLEHYSDVASVHLALNDSGADGAALQADCVQAAAEEVAGWRDALADDATIDVHAPALDRDGLQLAADLTGADMEAVAAPQAAERILVLIDSRVSDANQLAAGAVPGAEVVLVDSGDDPLSVLDTAIRSGGAVSAIHIIGHGSAGSLLLGDGTLDAASLEASAQTLSGWADHLTADADILLYGCDVGDGPAGSAMLNRLATLTGADVAASADDVGGHAAGTDWTLEVQTGRIEASLPIDSATAEAYAHSLTTAPTLADSATTTRFTGEDTSLVITGISVTDPDAAEQITLTITATNGTVTVADPNNLISGEGTGSTLTLVGTAANLNSVLSNSGKGSLSFKPADNFNKATGTISLQANDGDQSSAALQVTVNITAKNDAPVLTPPTGTGTAPSAVNSSVARVNEGAGNTVTLTAANLGIADIDTDTNLNAAPQTPEQVMFKITSLPEHGKLLFDPTTAGNGVADARALVVGSLFSWQDLLDGKIVYQHGGDQANNLTTVGQTDSFGLSVNDGAGGLASGTVQIDIVPVNQAPVVDGAVKAGEVAFEGRSQVPVTVTLTDVDDNAGGTFTFTFGALANANGGRLYLDQGGDGYTAGTDVDLTAGGSFTGTLAQLNAQLRFDVGGAEPLSSAPSFSLSVRDEGGGTGTHGGADVLNPLTGSGTVTIDVRENNDDPVLAVNAGATPGAVVMTIASAEARIRQITGTDLRVDDNDSPPETRTYTLTAIPPDTMLVQVERSPGNWVNLGVGGSFTQKDIADNKVRLYYRGGGTAAGGTDFHFDFAVRDGEITVFSTVRQVIDIREGGTRNAGDTAYLTHSFNVRVVLEGSAGLPGTDPGVTYETNLAPTGVTAVGITSADVAEGGTVQFGGTGTTSGPRLIATDPDTPVDQLVYRLESLPSGGTLTLGGRALGLYSSFTQADVDAGLLAFTHNGGEDFQQSFSITVSDGRSVTSPATVVSIAVRPVNDTPGVSVAGTAEMKEGDRFTFNAPGAPVTITLTDVDGSGDITGGAAYQSDNGSGSLPDLVFILETLPTAGKLYFDADGSGAGAAVLIDAANRTSFRITQADLSAGKLVYVHDGDEVFTDSFQIRVDDGQPIDGSGTHSDGTSGHGSHLGNTATVTLRIAPINDDPAISAPATLTNTGARVVEGGTVVISGSGAGTKFGGDGTAQLTASDPDNNTRQIQFRIESVPTQGTLYRNGLQLGVGSVFTQQDLNQGLVSYRHNGAEATVALGQVADSFTFRVSDAGGGTEPLQTFQIEVQPTNDAPQLTAPSGPVAIDSAIPSSNTIGGFTITDPDLADTVLAGETDEVTVIVRLLDSNGTAIADYANVAPGVGVTFGFTPAGSVTSAVGPYTGENTYLVLRGGRADVQSALNSLTVTFDGDLDARFTLQVIVDDRLRDASGALLGGANGGTLNDNPTAGGPPVALSTTATALSAWAGAVTIAADDPNLVARTVELRASSVNDPVTLTVPAAQTVAEDTRTRISGISVADPESSAFDLPIRVTFSVPSGQGTLDIGGTNTQTTITPASGQPVTISGDGTSSITVTGRASDIAALLSDSSLGLFFTSASNRHGDQNSTADGDVTLTVSIDDYQARIGGDTGSGSVDNVPAPQTIALTITAVNDAPSLSIGTAKITVAGTETPANLGSGVVSDVDLTGTDAGTDTTDYVRVTVRLLTSGSLVYDNSARLYPAGATLTPATGAGTATVVGSYDGVGKPLVLEGTRAQVNASLAGLTLNFGTGSANDAESYKLQVIVDDRLRDGSGALTGLANGGDTNQTSPAAISTSSDVNPYAAAPTSVFNVKSATRDVFVSGINDPAAVTGTDFTVGEQNTVGGTGGRVAIGGGNDSVVTGSPTAFVIADPDDNGSTTLTATITVPTGFIIQSLGTAGTGNTGAITSGTLGSSNVITITGNEAGLNSMLAGLVVGLPDAAPITANGTTVDPAAGDWHGTFTVDLLVNDMGSTGTRPASLPGGDAASGTGQSGYADGSSSHLTTRRTITVTVQNQNDSPAYTAGRHTLSTPVAEDTPDHAAPVQAIADLIGSDGAAIGWNDGKDDVSATTGGGNAAGSPTYVAIVGYHNGTSIVSGNADQGVWQYSLNGTDWHSVPLTGLSTSNALILPVSAQVRFVPNAGTEFHGTPFDLALSVSDGSTSYNPGAADQPQATTGITTGGTSSWGSALVRIGTTVTPVNDRPTASPASITVAEGNGNPAGTALNSGTLFGGTNYKDVADTRNSSGNGALNIPGGGDTATSFGGVAVVGNAADPVTQGVWEYSTDEGANWNSIGTGLSDANALLLPATAQLRFRPTGDANGDGNGDFIGVPPALEVRVSDAPVSLTSSMNLLGGVDAEGSHWSAKTTVTATVTAVNDAPLLVATPANPTVVESAATGTGTDAAPLFSGVSLSDVDLPTTPSLSAAPEIFGAGTVTVRFTGGYRAGDVLAVDTTLLGPAGAVLTSDGVGKALTIQLGTGATRSQVEAIIASVTYRNSSDDPAGKLSGLDQTNRTYELVVNDGRNSRGAGTDAGAVAQNSNAIQGTLTITPGNDAPDARDNAGNVNEDAEDLSGNVRTDTDGTAGQDSDPDDPLGTLVVSGVVAGVSATPASTGVGTGITGTYGTLTLQSDGSWTYKPGSAAQALNAGQSAQDIFTYTLSDPSGRSDTATLAITVTGSNDVPTIPGPGNVVETPEDTDRILSAADFPFADADTGQVLERLEISPPTRGQLILDGVVVSAPTLVTRAQLDAGKLVFRPAADENNEAAGTDYASFSFKVGDAASLSADGTMRVDVVPANDRPVASGAPALPSVLEDAQDPPGQTVDALFGSAYQDTADDTAVSDGVDADTPLAGIAIVGNAATEAQGVWQFKIGTGAWTDVPRTGLSDGAALVLPKTALLRFLPARDFAGTPGELSVRLSDGTGFHTDPADPTLRQDLALPGNGPAGTQTGGWSAATIQLSTDVTPVNAPVLSDRDLVLVQREDAPAPAGAVGTLVSMLVGGGADVDPGHMQGIAVIAADSGHGIWWFSTDGGASWAAFPDVGEDAALLLQADDDTRVYFQPDADWNGTVPAGLTIRAWDGTVGSNGGTAAITATGGRTAFSAETDSVTLQVEARNDAPVAAGTATVAPVGEDAIGGRGQTVAELVGPLYSDATDSVPGGSNGTALAGIAIVGNAATEAQGRWEYSLDGTSWIGVPAAPSPSAALLLPSSASLRFVPAANWNGTPGALTVHVSDGTGFTGAGTASLAGATGGENGWSTGTVTIGTRVTAVNDAPVAGGTAALPGFTNEGRPGSAAALSTLLGGSYTDATDTVAGGSTGTPLAGFAIVANAASADQGSWQISTDGGITWITVPATVSDGAALVVDAGALVRFLPTYGFTGTPGALGIRLSDGTGLVTGSAVDLGGVGGTGGWSAATVSLVTTLTPPVLAEPPLDSPTIPDEPPVETPIPTTPPPDGSLITGPVVDLGPNTGSLITAPVSAPPDRFDGATPGTPRNGSGYGGLLSTLLRFDAVDPGQRVLTLVGQVPNQVVIENRPYEFQVSRGNFRHANPEERLRFEATRPDGSPLPAWMSFDAATLRFEGTPPPGTRGSVEVVLIARDSNGNQVAANFRININDDVDENGAPTQEAVPDGTDAPDPAVQPDATPAGREPTPQDGRPERRVDAGGADFALDYQRLANANDASQPDTVGRSTLAAQFRAAGQPGRIAEVRALLDSLAKLPDSSAA